MHTNRSTLALTLALTLLAGAAGPDASARDRVRDIPVKSHSGMRIRIHWLQKRATLDLAGVPAFDLTVEALSPQHYRLRGNGPRPFLVRFEREQGYRRGILYFAEGARGALCHVARSRSGLIETLELPRNMASRMRIRINHTREQAVLYFNGNAVFRMTLLPRPGAWRCALIQQARPAPRGLPLRPAVGRSTGGLRLDGPSLARPATVRPLELELSARRMQMSPLRGKPVFWGRIDG